MTRNFNSAYWTVFGVLGLLGSVNSAVAQVCNCSCDSVIPPTLGVQAAFMNDGGGGPTNYVTGGIQLPMGGCQSVQMWHANEFQFPGGTFITDVCVALKYPDGQPMNIAYVFFAQPDPNNANLPGNLIFEHAFTVNVNGGHQIVNLGGGVSVFGQTWVGVRYPTARCHIPHQGVAQRVQGRAAVWVDGPGTGGWKDYEDPLVTGQGAAYHGNVPIIRPLTLGTIGGGAPAGVFVSTGGTAGPLVTDECGRSAGFSVVLTRVPAQNRTVLVSMSVTNPMEAELNTTGLIFNAANWNIPQNVLVTGRDDPVPDGDQPYHVVFQVSSLDPAYHQFPVPPIPCINEDNDDVQTVCPQVPSEWRDLTPHGTSYPIIRSGHALAYDSDRQVIVIFGGLGALPGFGVLNDTWEWNGSSWTVRTGMAPPPRERHAMVYDANRRVTVLFGGVDLANNIFYQDTWEWDGVSWQLRSPGMPNAPGGPRAGHAMVYDSIRQTTILYGGEFTANTDTWEWDGTTWFQRAFPNNPGLRWGHAMSYDAATGRIVLFGGDVGGGLNQTWALDPNNDWSVTGFAGFSPPHQMNASMTYDFNRGVHVLFGGEIPGGPSSNETWEWNDGAQMWTPIQTLMAPPPRARHAMAFDPVQAKVLVFGGADFSTGVAYDDTWEYPFVLGLPSHTRLFCISGAATGAPWSWAIRGPGFMIEDIFTPGLNPGDSAELIAQRFVDRINRVCCDTVRARVLPTAPTCFEVTIDNPVMFDFCVGPAGAPANCCVFPGTSCLFNPRITGVLLTLTDCNMNGIDDAIDVAIDPSLDANGNGIIDSCEGFLSGDMNCDGVVTPSDIAGFVLALTNPAQYAAQFPNCNALNADMNGDGIVTPADIAPFVAVLIGP